MPNQTVPMIPNLDTILLDLQRMLAERRQAQINRDVLAHYKGMLSELVAEKAA